VPLTRRFLEGGPVLPVRPEDGFRLPSQLVGDGKHFMLKVSGDSMADAGIGDGDWVVIRQGPQADHGDLVAALVNGETTVQTFERADGKGWLRPQNPAFARIPADQAAILGRIVSVMRRIRP
jgi:repressor LexA